MGSNPDNDKTELKAYVSPATEVIRYNEEDIILTSNGESYGS